MKKLFLVLLTFIAFANKTYSQEYQEHLIPINNFLKTFDSGYYGPLSVDNKYIYCEIKGGKQSKIPYAEILEAKVITPNKMVKIICKQGDCVFGVTGAKYDSLSFRTEEPDFDTTHLAFLLNILINSLRE